MILKKIEELENSSESNSEKFGKLLELVQGVADPGIIANITSMLENDVEELHQEYFQEIKEMFYD